MLHLSCHLQNRPSTGRVALCLALVIAGGIGFSGTSHAKETGPRWPWQPKTYPVDPRLVKAAEIAEQRAQPRMTWYCWRYVKDALLAAGAVRERPSSRFANRAGAELTTRFGFKRLPIRDPYQAPTGAVIVYSGNDGGHVELRCRRGFVSDFVSETPYPRPLIGVFVTDTGG